MAVKAYVVDRKHVQRVKMYRVEDKYFLSDTDQFILKERLKAIMSSDSNEKDDRGYRISSVYFDDYRDTHYHDTVSGNPEREKYRIRIYNDSLDDILAEIKIKKYSRIRKIQARISREQMNCLMNGVPAECSNDTPDNPVFLFNTAIKTRLLRPKVIVTYERKAFICQSGNVRITFDTGVRASNRIDMFGSPDIVYDHPQDEDSVLEVKYDEFLPDYIDQTLQMNQMLQTSFSKYMVCREIYM